VTAVLHCGDVRHVLAGLPEQSVQCCVTSPPYWGLRDYGTATWDGGTDGCDHIEKRAARRDSPGGYHNSRDDRSGKRQPATQATVLPFRDLCGKCGARRVDNQLGLERTPEEYVATMVAVFREVRRVLRDDGVLWLNLGDSYATTPGKPNGNLAEYAALYYRGGAHYATERPMTQQNRVTGGLKPKDLVGIPWMVAFALRSDGWYLRSDIIWAKPNPMPESVTDRPTKAHEYLFLLTKSERYYYDAAAIQEPTEPWNSAKGFNKDGQSARNIEGRIGNRDDKEQSGRNARTVWAIATQPYAGAHFATFPEELARRCILAGSAAKACESCGAPWERVTEREAIHDSRPRPAERIRPEHGWGGLNQTGSHTHLGTKSETVGWQPTCVCEANTGTAQSTVLDPFGGSGTVAAVATGHGRRATYIDLNPAYLDLAEQRIGPMLCSRAQPEKDAA
jgi:DNA modification methylase